MTPTIEEQTGWIGLLPDDLCEDYRTLLRITEYDYDIDNAEFLHYCEERGITNRIIDNQILQQFYKHHGWGKKAFFQTMGGPHTDNGHLTVAWRGVLAARGALQDCWELWTLRR